MGFFKRRSPSTRERSTPCKCCGWPVSERHHLLKFSLFGENEYTVQLCASCHDLYHVFWNALVEEDKQECDPLRDPFLRKHIRPRLLASNAITNLEREGKGHIARAVLNLAREVWARTRN